MVRAKRIACLLSVAVTLLAMPGFAPTATGTTYSLSPTDDTWAYQYDPDRNYGGETGFATAIQYMSPRGYAFLKFSIPTYPGEFIESAKLSLYEYPGGGGYGEGPTAILRYSNNNWQESTLTWNTMPTGTTTLLATNPNGHSYVGWSYWEFPWSLSFGNTLTLLLGENSSGDQSHWWHSKEYTGDPSLRPYLALTTSTIAAPLWQHQASGDVYRWQMDGTTMTTGAYVRQNMDPAWQIVATGDFNHDGKVDAVLQHTTSGAVYVWLLDHARITNGAWIATGVGGGWHVAAAGDLNGDGNPDLIWRNVSSGDVYVWLMQGTAVTSGVYMGRIANLDWTLVATGDMNHDGQTDLLWHNSTTGDVYVWYMSGTSVSRGDYLKRGVDRAWQLVGAGDFSKDGKPDLLWYSPTTGDIYVWFMDGAAVTGGQFICRGMDPAWRLMGPK